ncbi:MAG: glycosyltransferase [Verrucomicrobiota bacterium]
MSKQNAVLREDSSKDAEQFITLTDLISIIYRRCLLSTTLAVLSAVLLGLLLSTQDPTYEAKASIIVELNPANIVNVTEVVDTEVQSLLFETAMNTHIEALKSRALTAAVIKGIDPEIAQRVLPSYPYPEEGEPDPLIDYTRNALLSVTWLTDSQVIEIGIKHEDPYICQLLANKYVETYIKREIDRRNDATSQAVSFLDEQTEVLQENLKNDKLALQNFVSENQLISIEQNQALISDKLSILSVAITEAEVRKHSINSRLRQITEAGDDLEALLLLPYIGNRAAVAKSANELESLRREDALLRETYSTKDLKRIENQIEQEQVANQLSFAIQKSREDYESELKAINSELDELRAAMDEAENEASQLEAMAIEHDLLTRRLEARRDIFDTIAERFNETNITSQVSLTTIRVLDQATNPRKPVWPNKKKIALACAMLFGAVFIAVPFGFEFLDPRIRNLTDARRSIPCSVLGSLPLVRNATGYDLVNPSESGYVEFDKQITRLFEQFALEIDHKISLGLMITSAAREEGKTITALNLGRAFAENKFRTLVIDCNLRRPSITKHLNVTNANGLLQYLNKKTSVKEKVEVALPKLHTIKKNENFKVLHSGGTTSHPGELLRGPELAELVNNYKQNFDIVIYDTPAIGENSDAAHLAPLTDKCVLVSKELGTTRERTKETVGKLTEAKIQIDGFIYNGARESDFHLKKFLLFMNRLVKPSGKIMATNRKETAISNPTVCVVTVVYNNLEGLKATYSSFREQDCTTKCMIIVDGASSDGTSEFLETLNDQPDLEFISEPDEGLYDAMNKGLMRAKSDYVIFMNGGDTFFNQEVLTQSLEELKIQKFPDILYCSGLFCFPNGGSRFRASREPEAIWHGQPALHQATYFKTQIHQNFHYDIGYKVSADYNLICRLSDAGAVARRSDLVVCRFITDLNSVSAKNKNIVVKENAKSQREVLSLPWPVILLSLARRVTAMSIISFRRRFS